MIRFKLLRSIQGKLGSFHDTIQVDFSQFINDTFQKITKTILSKSSTCGESIQAKMTRFKRHVVYNYMQAWYARQKITQGHRGTKIARCFNIALIYTT